MAGRVAHALELGALLVVAVWLAESIVGEAVYSGASVWPWHRMTAGEAYRIGTQDRFSFVSQRTLIFRGEPTDVADLDALGAPPQDGVVVAAFTADGGVDGTSAITIFGDVTDPSARVIAHEYGHALLWDYPGVPHARGDHQLNVAFEFKALSGLTLGKSLDPRVATENPEFAPLLREYERAPSALGDYASQTFGEWFAEANHRSSTASPFRRERRRS